MLDFKLEYSGSLQEFDGVDYADLRAREEEKRQKHCICNVNVWRNCKRERTKKVIYNAEAYFREQDKKNEATMPKPVIIVKKGVKNSKTTYCHVVLSIDGNLPMRIDCKKSVKWKKSNLMNISHGDC